MTISSDQAFQFVFDKAESLAVNRRQVVGQSITRNGIVRSVSRGPTPWTFTVKLPDGMRWSDTRDIIQVLDTADKITTANVALTDSGYATWLGSTPGFSGNTWNVVCIDMPNWTISSRDQVSWSGPFVFSVYVP
jgi:hypothetical protein